MDPSDYEQYAEPIVKAIIFGDQGLMVDASSYTSSSIEKAGEEGKSQRLIGDRFSSIRGQLEVPPFTIDVFAITPDISTRLRRSVEIIATNIAAYGWRVTPKFKVDEDTDKEKIETARVEAERVEELLDSPNSEMPFSALMEIVITDLETIGNGYIEVVRNQETDEDPLGKITQLWHVPAATVRIRRDGIGFVQIKGTRKRYFKNYGDDTVVNAGSGRSDEAVPIDERANELIHFKIYSVRSDFYGVPRYLASSPSISGARLAAKRNIAFFENDAVPRGMILVSGGQIQNESVKMLTDFFNFKGKGAEKAHRLAVVQVQSKGPALGAQPKTTIEWVPVTVGVTDDASFLEYTKAANEEIREAFGIAKIFYTDEGTNRASGIEARAITNEQTFEPERCKIEFRINQTIMKSFGVKEVKFEFIRPKLIDPLNMAKIDQIYSRIGALTPNEVRVRTLDLPPYPKETGMGDVPIQVTIVDRQIAARDAQGEMQPDTGATANEPPGGPQDNIRENERELAEVFAFMKEEWGDEIIVKMNGGEYELEELKDMILEA